MVEKTNKNFRS